MRRFLQVLAVFLFGTLVGGALMQERLAHAEWFADREGRQLERLVRASEDSARSLAKIADKPCR